MHEVALSQSVVRHEVKAFCDRYTSRGTIQFIGTWSVRSCHYEAAESPECLR